MMPVKPRSDPVTRAAVTSLTIGGSCLGSLTAEASCARRKNVPKAAAPLDAYGEETLAVYQLPEGHRKRMRSTNMLERITRKSNAGRG